MLSSLPAPGIHRVSPGEAATLLLAHRRGALPSLAVFDVREPGHYHDAHIADAEHLTEASFPYLARRLPKGTPILVYCYRGDASQGWAETFADFRFTRAYSVDGGYPAFAAAVAAAEGGPVVIPLSPGPELLGFLCAHRFDPEALDEPREHGLTALMRAALAGRANLVAELLALGADVKLRNADGNNALWLACVADSADSVRQLLAAGIDIDNRNVTGATCLMYCASAGKAAMVALLLESGADPLLINQDDARAVDLAATRECLRLLRAATLVPKAPETSR